MTSHYSHRRSTAISLVSRGMNFVLRLSALRRDNGNVVGPPTTIRTQQRVDATSKVE